ncbi:hypothetical protein Mapa_015073 [Marchantia paleacea]|nr:hypothetical protein Mapa_015073 [Marchantia paleacea]
MTSHDTYIYKGGAWYTLPVKFDRIQDGSSRDFPQPSPRTGLDALTVLNISVLSYSCGMSLMISRFFRKSKKDL